MTYPKIANRIIEWGIIFLIVFTPIAFGAVHPWAYTVMELTVCFLVIIWIVRLAMLNINKTTMFPNIQSAMSYEPSTIHNRQSSIVNHQSLLVNRFGFIKTPLTIPIIIFVGLILFQLTPLPPGVLKIISPNTYKLYKTTLPDWQTDESSNQQIYESTVKNPESTNQLINESTILNLESQIFPPEQVLRTGSWRPITVYKHATKTELYKILAYIGMFFLIVNYNPSTRSRQPTTREHRSQIKTLITRFIIAMVVVGCFESIYGLLECLSGHQHIFFREKLLNSDTVYSVTGTYINRNHFAGYMALVICMGFGYITYLFSDLSRSEISSWHHKLSKIINLIGTRAGLLSFLILIMTSALIMSGSRMGICSFIAVIILMSFMISNKVTTQQDKAELSSCKMSIKKITLIFLPVCLMTVWMGLNPVINRFSHTSMDVKAEEGRVQVWKDSFTLVKDFPALGTGLGTYEYIFQKYKTFTRQVLYDHAHNDYVELMSDTGITGFIIVIAGAAWYLFVAIKMWFCGTNPFVRGIAAGCLGGIAYIILHSLTDFNLHIPANALHLSIITGIMHKTITQL